jgi:glycosyltransferase 2 family protein
LKKTVPPAIKTLLKLLITAIILYFIFTKIQIEDVWDVFSQANFLYLIPALFLFVFSKWIASERLFLFLHALSPVFSKLTNLKLYLMGMFYNLFLPGGIGGDGYKIFLLHRNYQMETKKAFWGILIDRLSGMATLLLLAILISSMIRVDFVAKHWILFCIPAFYALYVLLFPKIFPYFKLLMHRTFLYSLVVQLAQIIQIVAIMAAFGIHDQYMEYLLVFLISGIISVLPITVGGIGARELTFLIGAQWLGLNQEASVSISLMFYLITAFTSLAGIYFHFRPGDLKLEQKK